MSAAVERRLAEFRAARGSAAASPRPAEPPGEAMAAEAAAGQRAAAAGPGGSVQVSAEAGRAGARGGGSLPDATSLSLPDATSRCRLHRPGPAGRWLRCGRVRCC